MSANYDVKDLAYWDDRIRDKVAEFGLDCFPQEFELCDHAQMLSVMAYSGMPSHYPHWSYGKSFERQKTLYDHGASGLPYEMVINSDPSIAYLMRDNTLCLQILTIAHVYGHNDFFKNNFTFSHIKAERVVGRFKANADRVRRYVETPSIGRERVEATLDAAHALSLQCRRNTGIRKLEGEEHRDWIWSQAMPARDPFGTIHKADDFEEPDLSRVPLEPEEDILLFIRDHNPRLAEWQRDLLGIVHEQTLYFMPQIETKTINEGWASYWHRTIMNSLDLPHDIQLEFLVRHNQVVRPIPGDINPYHLGLKLWDAIEEKDGREAMFPVREVDRDVSFLRRFLTPEILRDLDLFEYEKRGDEYIVSNVADEEHWQTVKETLIRGTGMGRIPRIRVIDADFGGIRTLLLDHEFDGRELDAGYAEKTIKHLFALWGRDVMLETRFNGEAVTLIYDGDSFTQRKGDAAA